MSNIYIQEPPTHGKVLLRTTLGDIDIELWSKETPKACRNFVQLCLEKYYDGTVFHRVVKGFIAQGGDPNGDGTGGESIYGKPFKDEFHSRLRFVRRGLVAMANAGKDDNGSQFFFTLGASPELQNKHTIFGKVAGDTLYNMLKLEDCIVDADDRPLYPPMIHSTKILMNPFLDIIPRILTESEEEKKVEEPKNSKQKNFNLLSFGEEAEEEDIEENVAVELLRGKSKSSHDLVQDPKLSSVSASSLYEENAIGDAKSRQIESIRKKLKVEGSQESKVNADANFSKDKSDRVDERKKIREQIKNLTKELRKSHHTNSGTFDASVNENKTVEENDADKDNILLTTYHSQLEHFKEKKTVIPSCGKEREKQTLNLLAEFCNKLKAANSADMKDKTLNEDELSDDESWLNHKLHFDEEVPVLAKDANLPSAEKYDITDPRHPINERRRTSSNKKSEKRKLSKLL